MHKEFLAQQTRSDSQLTEDFTILPNRTKPDRHIDGVLATHVQTDAGIPIPGNFIGPMGLGVCYHGKRD